MKQSKILLGSTAIIALAFLGSSCAKTETQVETTTETSNSMEMNETETRSDSMDNMENNSEETTAFTVDLESSNMNWLGKKVTGQHQGDIKLSSGSFEAENGVPVSGTFVIDMKSMTLTNEEPNEGLMDHLRGEDFFAVEENPTATFTLTSCEKISGNEYTVNGDLTIKGITKAISFPATITTEDSQLMATGVIPVDRTEYDIRYGSGKFFENIGDKAIDDIFTLDLDLVAKAS